MSDIDAFAAMDDMAEFAYENATELAALDEAARKANTQEQRE